MRAITLVMITPIHQCLSSILMDNFPGSFEANWEGKFIKEDQPRLFVILFEMLNFSLMLIQT